MQRVVFLAMAMTTTAATLHAEPVPLAENALRELASGKTVHLESPYGTLPVSFKADGTLSGKASGLLAGYLGATSDRGRWTVHGDRICQKFFKWFNGETHCMRIKADGRRITWRRDDGLSGTATIAANDAAPLDKPLGLGAPAEQVARAITAAIAPQKPAVATPPRFAAASAASISDARPVNAQSAGPAPEVVVKRSAPVKVAALPPATGLALSSGEAEPATTAHLTAVLAITMPPHALIGEMFRARLRHGWCHAFAAQSNIAAAAAAGPALLIVARGGTPGATTERDLAGCLAITPPLADILRSGAASQ